MADGWGRVERPDAEIWYLDTAGDGDGDLPVLVLLHGLAGYALEWGALMAAMRTDHRVIAIEQRGHGSSTRRPADTSLTAYVEDVVAVLDDLGVARTPVVGQSMGGHIAMMLAAQHPERVSRLVMIEAGLGGGDPGDLEGLATWLRSWPVPFAAREDFLAFFGGSRSVAEDWADGLEKRADGLWPQWDAEVLVRAISGVFDHEHLDEWSAVHAPVLLVRGEHGSVPERQVESMCALRPSTELAVIAGAGHDVHLETPEALTPLLQRFLAQP